VNQAVNTGQELLNALMDPEVEFIILKSNVTIDTSFWPVDGANINRTVNLLGDKETCGKESNRNNNDKHSYAGQLNSFTQFRALLVLHDRGFSDPIN
jgi:hypothetical protein